jgi:hypothetical protein
MIIKTNAKQVFKEVKNLVQAAEKAFVRMLNKVRDRTFTETHRFVRKDYFVKQKDITTTLKKKFKATKNNPKAFLRFEDSRRNVWFFSAKKRKKGVAVRVKKSSSPKVLTGSWLRLIGGANRVYRRSFTGGIQAKRLPIESVSGPAVTALVSSKQAQGIQEKVIRNEWTKIFEHEYNFFKGKIKKN